MRKARSSHLRCSIKEGVPKKFAKFTRKHLCQSLFFNKIAGLKPATLLKRDSGTGLKPATLLKRDSGTGVFAKFLGTPFLQNTSRQL